MVGNSTGVCDQSTVAGGAPGKKSNATNTDPVSRFPVRNCARTPRDTRESNNFLRMASKSAWDFKPRTLTPSRCASKWMVTGTENSRVFTSTCARTAATSPIGTPRNSTGAPGTSPLTDSLKMSSKVCGLRAAGLKASARSSNRVKTVFASATGRTAPVAGASNAMPPIRIDSSDWVCTLRPLAESDRSIDNGWSLRRGNTAAMGLVPMSARFPPQAGIAAGELPMASPPRPAAAMGSRPIIEPSSSGISSGSGGLGGAAAAAISSASGSISSSLGAGLAGAAGMGGGM